MADTQTKTTSTTTSTAVKEAAPTLEAVKDAAAVVETDTVTVDIPQDGGLLAYLTGPNMKIDLTAVDFENSELTVEDGNLRLTLPNGQGEILLLDYTVAVANAESAPVVILSENSSVAGNVLLSALAHANQTAEEIQPAAGPEGVNTVASQRGADTVSDSGYFIPESSDAGFGDDQGVISEVIAPFTIAPKFDDIIEELHPNEPSSQKAAPANTAPTANNDTATTHAETAVTINVLANDTDPENDALTITTATNGSNGSVSIVNNQLVYTPNAGFLGTDTFTYDIEDGNGGTSSATVTVTVTNTAPDAVDDTRNTHADTPITIDVLANDSDADADTYSITSTTNPSNGTIALVGGQIVYTPNTGFTGTDTFTYTITDDHGATDTATVTINVTNTNPDAVNDTRSTHVDTPITIDVLANDSDPENDPLSISGTTNPSNGTISVVGGQIVYTPTAGFVGTDTFTYTISDGFGGADTATVTINVTNTNPDAVNDTRSTHAGVPVTIDVLANDSDPENDPLSISGTTNPSNGTISVVGGQIVYTPNAGFVGTDTFTYTISDGFGGTDTATVTINVGNAAPTAVADTATTHCGTPVTVHVTNNDSDPDGDSITLTAVNNGSHGTTSIVNGQVVYTPTGHYVGTDTFTYTITDAIGATSTATVTVTITNTAPDAVNDTRSTHAGTPVTVNVLANDTDADGDSFSITATTNPSNGSISVVNGQIVYTPNAGFNGTDSFTYTISDGCGASDTATVTINVTNTAPDAKNDTATTHCGTAVTINVLANDSDPENDTLTITAANNGAHGTTSIVNGQIVYIPAAGFVGTDTFTYTISDGNGGTDTATVTVNITNAAPDAVNDARTTTLNTAVNINVLANDSDADGDSISITSASNGTHGTTSIVNGQIVYTPATGFIGTDTFTYTISDGCGGTDTATVTVTVKDPNSAPDARNDSTTTHCGVPVAVNVLANDTDVDGDSLTITAASNGAHGTTSIVNGQIVYTPAGHYVGTDSFTYTISDGHGGVDTATVYVNITNTAPDARNDSRSTAYQTPVTINVLGNDVDADGDSFSITSTSNPSHGSISVVNGQIVYTPNNNYNGTDTFTYTITDSCGATDTATVSVNVGAKPNTGPDARNDSATTHCGVPVTINALSNDTDADGDSLTITSANNGSHGSVRIVNGQLVYTPNGHYVGTDSFTYTISDGHGGTDTARVTVNVTNTAPDARNDSASVNGGGSVAIYALSNDIDADGDSISITSYNQPSVGSVSLVNGHFVYNAPNGYNGSTSFTYTITDSCGATDTATVTVNVRSSGGGGGGGGGGDDCPLILDLNGDGLTLVSLTQSAAIFDMDNDGVGEHTSWVGGDDNALLVFDRDNSGTIDNRNELFGNTETADNGFTRLAEMDTNGDGVIDANDAGFSSIQLWLDDGDGVSEDGELFGLDHFGIVAINTDGTFVNTTVDGHYVSHEGTFTYGDGSTGTVSDVWFSYEEVADNTPVAADETLTITTDDVLAGTEATTGADATDYAAQVFSAESIHGDFDAGASSSTTDTLTQIGLDAAHNTDTLA